MAMETKTTKYIVKQEDESKKISVIFSTDSKKEAFEQYQYFCDRNHNSRFFVIQEEIFSSVVADSGSAKQLSFSF
jgi:hypothetical protein